jgi:hypothetical protein
MDRDPGVVAGRDYDSVEYEAVIAGLDPAIHLLRKTFSEV